MALKDDIIITIIIIIIIAFFYTTLSTSSQCSWLLLPEIFPPALIEALSKVLAAVSKHSVNDHQGSHAGPCCPLCVRTVRTSGVVSEKSTSLPSKATPLYQYRVLCSLRVCANERENFGMCVLISSIDSSLVIVQAYCCYMPRYSFN